jgi:hypothetical protein
MRIIFLSALQNHWEIMGVDRGIFVNSFLSGQGGAVVSESKFQSMKL